MCAVAAADHKLAQTSLAIQSLQGREELAKTPRVPPEPALLILVQMRRVYRPLANSRG